VEIYDSRLNTLVETITLTCQTNTHFKHVTAIIEHMHNIWIALGNTVVELDAVTFKEFSNTPLVHTSTVNCIVSVDTKLWAACLTEINVWDTELTLCIKNIVCDIPIFSMVNVGGLVVTAGRKPLLYVWDSEEYTKLTSLPSKHSQSISAVYKERDYPLQLWTASYDETICLWK